MNKRLRSLKTLDSNQYLQRLVEIDRVPSSLLFCGPKSAKKEEAAENFAKLLVKSSLHPHPDVHRYRPEGKIGMHSLENIRQLREEAYLPPYQATRKVFLLFEADRMLSYSANAMLKIFEEPPRYNTIILVSSVPEKILPTILSRCHTIPFKGEASCQITVNKTLLQLLANRKILSYPQLLKAIKQLLAEIEIREEMEEESKDLTAFQVQQIEKHKEGSAAMQQLFAAESFFEQILGWFRDMLLIQLNGPAQLLYHLDHIEEVKQACQRGEFVSLEKLQQAIADAKLSLERSTPIQHVFEYFFLTLAKT